MLIEILNIDDINSIYKLHGSTSRIILMNKGSSINYLGLGYIKMLLDHSKIYNYFFLCNVLEDAYAAQTAFKMGFTKVYYTGNDINFNKLENIAAKYNAKLFNEEILQEMLK